MYGIGMPTYSNYMMPVNAFPVMQSIPQFQVPQLQPMGNLQQNLQGLNMMQMSANMNMPGSNPDEFDEEIAKPLKQSSQRQHQGKGQKQNQKNTNNREGNQGNTRQKSNNQNRGNQNQEKQSKARNNQKDLPEWAKDDEDIPDGSNYALDTTGTMTRQNNSKQGGSKQNNAKEKAQSNQIGELPEDDVEQLIEQACVLSKDQTGCRKLQKKLEAGDQMISTRIFERILPSFGELMIDPFGNYLCQKVVETCTKEQVAVVISKVKPELISICFNPHGTRAVQTLIEVCANVNHLIEQIVEALSNDVVGLVKVSFLI